MTDTLDRLCYEHLAIDRRLPRFTRDWYGAYDAWTHRLHNAATAARIQQSGERRLAGDVLQDPAVIAALARLLAPRMKDAFHEDARNASRERPETDAERSARVLAALTEIVAGGKERVA